MWAGEAEKRLFRGKKAQEEHFSLCPRISAIHSCYLEGIKKIKSKQTHNIFLLFWVFFLRKKRDCLQGRHLPEHLEVTPVKSWLQEKRAEILNEASRGAAGPQINPLKNPTGPGGTHHHPVVFPRLRAGVPHRLLLRRSSSAPLDFGGWMVKPKLFLSWDKDVVLFFFPSRRIFHLTLSREGNIYP